MRSAVTIPLTLQPQPGGGMPSAARTCPTSSPKERLNRKLSPMHGMLSLHFSMPMTSLAGRCPPPPPNGPPAPSRGGGGMPGNLPGALPGVVTVLPEQRVFASQTRYRPSPRRVHEWTVSRPTVPARMRRIDLQTVWWRRRAQAAAPAQPTTVPCFRFSPKQDQHPPDTLLLCTAPWSHAPGSGLPPRSGAGKHTRGWLDRSTPPALPRSSMVGRPRTGAAARSFR